MAGQRLGDEQILILSKATLRDTVISTWFESLIDDVKHHRRYFS